MEEMNKYIITGHLGQIGRELKKRLDNKGYECVGAFDRKDGGYVEGMYEDMVESDIIFHLAADCKINKCIENTRLALENGVNTNIVLEYARQTNKPLVVNFSSSRVLSSEENVYTAGKKFGENLLEAYKQCYGIDYINIRPSTVYGGEDETGRLFDIWINNAKEGKDLEIFGDRNKTLNFTHIDDFVNAVDVILDKGERNHSYDIFGFTYNLTDVANEIIRQTNSESKIVYKEAELTQPQKVDINDHYLHSLGYSPKIKIKEGIERYLKNGD